MHRRSKPVIKRRTFEISILVLILSILIFGGIISYYFLVYELAKDPASSLPTIYPSPTPKPKYNVFLNRPADYVGKITEIPKQNDLLVEREDQSKLIISLQSDIPVYKIVNNSGQIPTIETITTSDLKVGNTISVYTEGNTILALFVSND